MVHWAKSQNQDLGLNPRAPSQGPIHGTGTQGTGITGTQGLAFIICIPASYPSYLEGSPVCKPQGSNDNSLMRLG